MSERARLADLARDAYWKKPNETSRDGWLAVGDAILADRRERDVTAVEHMEARVEAADQATDLASLWAAPGPAYVLALLDRDRAYDALHAAHEALTVRVRELEQERVSRALESAWENTAEARAEELRGEQITPEIRNMVLRAEQAEAREAALRKHMRGMLAAPSGEPICACHNRHAAEAGLEPMCWYCTARNLLLAPPRDAGAR